MLSTWRKLLSTLMLAMSLTTSSAVVPATPSIRNPIAKAMYRKLMHETEHRCSGHVEWYSLDTVKFRRHIGAKWIQLKQDEQTLNFLEHCYDKSDWVLTQLYHAVAQSVLNWFMTKTSINGLLRRGSMFVFSTAHFGRLLHVTSSPETPETCACAFNARCPCVSLPPHRPPETPAAPPLSSSSSSPKTTTTTTTTTTPADSHTVVDPSSSSAFSSSSSPSSSPPSSPSSSSSMPPPPVRLLKTLLDLGAGDGEVTANMAPYFERVFATETSPVMRWRLEEKGYVLLDPFRWDHDDGGSSSSSSSASSSASSAATAAVAPRHFDVIACLNLLDRCSKPLALLHQIYDRLEPSGGRLVVALVLPFNPYVEFGPLSPEPEERLLVEGETVEDQINSLVDGIFAPIGFALEAITRLPYLCEGDLAQAFYVLEDVVFVFRKNASGGGGGGDAGSEGREAGSGGREASGSGSVIDSNATTITIGDVGAVAEDGFCPREDAPVI